MAIVGADSCDQCRRTIPPFVAADEKEQDRYVPLTHTRLHSLLVDFFVYFSPTSRRRRATTKRIHKIVLNFFLLFFCCFFFGFPSFTTRTRHLPIVKKFTRSFIFEKKGESMTTCLWSRQNDGIPDSCQLLQAQLLAQCAANLFDRVKLNTVPLVKKASVGDVNIF